MSRGGLAELKPGFDPAHLETSGMEAVFALESIEEKPKASRSEKEDVLTAEDRAFIEKAKNESEAFKRSLSLAAEIAGRDYAAKTYETNPGSEISNVHDLAKDLSMASANTDTAVEGLLALEKKIQSFEVHSEADIQKLDDLMREMDSGIRTAKEESARAKNLFTILEFARNAARAEVLRAAGVENPDQLFDKRQELSSKLVDLSSRIGELKDWRNGFGLIHRKEIARLEGEYKQIQNQYNELGGVNKKLDDIPTPPIIRDREWQIDYQKKRLPGEVHRCLYKRYQELAKEALNEEQEKVELNAEQLDQLNDAYVKEFFDTEVAHLAYNQKNIEELADNLRITPEAIARARAILKNYFDVPAYSARTSEQHQKVTSLKEEMQGLPQSLVHLVNKCRETGLESPNLEYVYMIDFARKLRGDLRNIELENSYGSVIKSYDSGRLQRNFRNKIDGFDFQRWAALMSNPQTRDMIGEGNIHAVELVMQAEIKKHLGDSYNRSRDMHFRNLMCFHNAENIQISLMGAYRHNETGPWVARFINSFSADELALLQEQNPDLTEAMAIVKKNPEEYSRYYTSEPGQRIINPILIEFKKAMFKSASNSLKGGDELEHKYALQMAEDEVSNNDFNWNKLYSSVDAFLINSKDQNLREKATDILINRAKRDTEALDVLLKVNQEDRGVWEAMRPGQWGEIVKLVADQPEKDEQHVKILADRLGLSETEMNDGLTFITAITKLARGYDPENVQLYFALSRNPETLPTVLELAKYGYHFHIAHTEQLLKVVERKDEIISQIVRMREVSPTFEYHMFPVSKIDKDGAVETRYASEPEEVLAYNPGFEETEEALDMYFNACRKYNKGAIIDGFVRYSFSDRFKSLPPEERDSIIDSAIKSSPESVVNNLYLLELSKTHRVELTDALLANHRYDSLRVLFHSGMPFDKGLILHQTLLKDPGTLDKLQGTRINPEHYTTDLESTIVTLLKDSELSRFNYYYQNIQGVLPEGQAMPEVPWADMLLRLPNLQKQSEHEEHDPWKQDLDPLVNALEQQGILSINEPKDAEIVFSFVQEYGMYNLPTVLKWHAALARARQLSDLDSEIKQEIEKELGLDLSKLSNKGMVTAEIRKFKDEMQSVLIADGIPKAIYETRVGEELFASLKGHTSWERGNKPADLIKLWEQTVSANPEAAKMPEGYKEVSFEVPIVVRRKLDVSEEERAEKKRQEILTNPDLVLTLERLNSAYSEASKIENLNSWWDKEKMGIVESIDEQVEEVKNKLTTIEDSKVRAGMEKQMAAWKKSRDEIIGFAMPDLNLSAEEFSDQEKTLVASIEALNKMLPAKLFGRDRIIRTVSATHALAVMEAGQRDQILNAVKQPNKSMWTKEDLSRWNSHMVDYLNEHYLNPEQKKDHIGHTPFSKALLKELQFAWTTKDIKNGIVQQKDRELKLLDAGSSEATGETITVTLVPARGILRVYSGDLGDACYTSQQKDLAAGKYEDLTSYTYVTGRNTKNEKFAGSVLVIETTNPQGEKVVLVRANNPRENLIQSVNSDILNAKVLEEMKALAIRRESPHVVVPLDAASMSSSNRRPVSEYYEVKFKDSPAMELTKGPSTNFNGYANWNPKGPSRCVKIN